MFNPDVHHRRSIRLRGYDYSSVGAYFVTICVQGRECLFGDVADGVMCLNDAGRMVEHVWSALPERFPGVALDECVIMPNHFHGIIVINDFARRGDTLCSPAFDLGDTLCSPAFDVGFAVNSKIPQSPSMPEPTSKSGRTQGYAPTDQNQNRVTGTTENSLGRVIQAFKSSSSVGYIHGVKEQNWQPFPGRLWQRNYYERIIRDDAELNGIREYIHHNPAQWTADDEY